MQPLFQFRSGDREAGIRLGFHNFLYWANLLFYSKGFEVAHNHPTAAQVSATSHTVTTRVGSRAHFFSIWQ